MAVLYMRKLMYPIPFTRFGLLMSKIHYFGKVSQYPTSRIPRTETRMLCAVCSAVPVVRDNTVRQD